MLLLSTNSNITPYNLLLQGEKAGMRGKASDNGDTSIPNENLPPLPSPLFCRERKLKKNINQK